MTDAGHEVDLVTCDPEMGHSTELIQVCTALTRGDTRERQIRALEEAMGETNPDVSKIVTLHDSETIVVSSGTIQVVPAWAWMLGIE